MQERIGNIFMNKFEGIAMLKQQFKQLKITTPPLKKVKRYKLKGCEDYRYSRGYQVAAKRALASRVDLLK